ncbi:hypothetical protein [Tunturiibacter gelidiferens]|uniref:hypothetical protein n=1 Tax=Tunturiibacter gelidiferens TaxID=3069689 RepID=UPI003D9B4D2D
MSGYDPRLTFAPRTLPNPVNGYRSSNGARGPNYWQNEADYELHAALDTKSKQLSTTEIIAYTNNSPDALTSLWVQVEQNIYKKHSRSRIASGGTRRRRGGDETGPPPSTEGYGFDSVEVEQGKQTTKVEYLVSETRMQIRLATPLNGHGGELKIHIKYHYAIPGSWGSTGRSESTSRTGRSSTLRPRTSFARWRAKVART